MTLFRSNLRLKPSILTSFVVLTVPVFFTIIAVTYLSNDRLARSSARELVERFRADAIDNIQSDVVPIMSLVRAAAALGDSSPEFYAGKSCFRYFHAILQHSPKIVSAYVGLEDGRFNQTRRIDPKVEVQGKLPPEGTRYAYRWITPHPGHPLMDHFVFLDDELRELGESEQATNYDPRRRLWYQSAVEAGKLTISDPDIFATLGLIGFTVAAPFYSDFKLLGVVAIDITLEGLGEYLSERKISPGTLSYIMDDQGRVIAATDQSKTYANVQGKLQLRHITALENELPAIAYSARPRGSDGLYTVDYRDKEYIASLTTLDVGKRWQLFIVTPMSDFTAAFQENNMRLVALGVLATVVQIIIIYFLTSIISAPLERLAFKVGKIQDLGTEQLPSINSSIREISVLSRAIDTLDAAVKSFSAFVPVGLVTQLLKSEQKLELGGHSRFLTIFFSDLEAFSSLSEEVPSQELLLRVSAYLELVTKTVNQEHGTIDKFIGDGVMAFWGAPALLEDHAWRSCVAAMRIQRGMDALNARWTAEELRPLNVRIGIHCDAVLVGNIGSRERMSYTVMGDGVNIAARLEGINKEFQTRICISHSVFKEAGERLCVRPIDDVVVKGRRAKVPIYELMGVYGADDPGLEPSPETQRLCKLTRLAYEALVKEDYAVAGRRYRDILEEFPEDPVAMVLARRLVTA
ncbi:MAG: adenylate/guanylate cyclase domain-containing protein [Pseudomonadota bacterium]